MNNKMGYIIIVIGLVLVIWGIVIVRKPQKTETIVTKYVQAVKSETKPTPPNRIYIQLDVQQLGDAMLGTNGQRS